MKDGKLQGKNVFNRKELLHIQDKLPEFLGKRGFDIQRGKEGSEADHVDFVAWKKKQSALEKDLLALRTEVQALETEKKDLKTDVQGLTEEKVMLQENNRRYRETLEVIDEDKVVEVYPRRVRGNNGQVKVDEEHKIIKVDDLNMLLDIRNAASIMKNDLDQTAKRARFWEKRAHLLEKANDELQATLKLAKRRIGKAIQGGSKLWDRCVTYAHQFHKKDAEVAEINKKVLGDVENSAGINDYKSWQKENYRQQQEGLSR